VLRSLHARYKLEGAESIYIRRLPLCDNFIIPLDIVCQVYSSTKPSTLRPLLAAPVNGVDNDCSSASNLRILSLSSAEPNTCACINSSISYPGLSTKPSGVTPSSISTGSVSNLLVSVANLGTSASACANNCLACDCVHPALSNACASSGLNANPLAAASPPICACVILPSIIASPTAGSMIDANI
jgi:hypothetical protein